ncbi:MAG: FAD-binding and (Fe-S)-binding domain-containing protein [Phycisphaerales bacterium]
MTHVALPQFKPSPSDPALDAIAAELAATIRGEVRFDAHNRLLYATDASLYQVEPLGVVIPADIDDARRIVELCAKHRLPLLPRGGGTSLAGQCTSRAIIMDLSNNCRSILNLDQEHRRVTVEPGITVDDLNDAISSTGLFFAADPATSRHANIGGCIGNNAAGARSIRYGRTSESIIALTCALADGRIARLASGPTSAGSVERELRNRVCEIVARHAQLIRERFPKTVRRNAGYGLDMVLKAMERAGWNGEPIPTDHEPRWIEEVNLAHLLCGSEGTLAVTLDATLALHPRPKAKGLAVLGFADLDESIAAVMPILSTHPCAIELLDDTVVDLARANNEYRNYVDLMPQPASGMLKAVLYVEYFADSASEIERNFAQLAALLPQVAMQRHTDTNAMLNAWKLRKAGEPLLHGIPGNRKPITFIEDNAIPVENLSRFVKDLRDIVASHGTRAAYYAHASVGVLHVRPLVDIHSESDRVIMRSIAVKAADLAKSLGGVMSGEHGDGKVRGPLLERFYGPELMAAFREIKAVFDPDNRLNPGNIVAPGPIESITESLRIRPRGRDIGIPVDIQTHFDYSDQHGFDHAVELCNGAGVCRKKQGGTMCPSYQATLDERHSTRGRGNALRLAITGQMAAATSGGSDHSPSFNDPGTLSTLDLCLSCKACKTECPSNVDVSKLKAEYYAQRNRVQGGASLADRFMGAIRTLNRFGSLMPGLSNTLSKLTPVRSLINAILRIHPRRSLPTFSTPLPAMWGDGSTADRKVALFGDCFSMYNESGIGMSAKRLLEAFGYGVSLADAGCCGRAKISMGMLPEAIDEIDATIERLRPLIEDPACAAILFSEPSCLSAIKDDWLTLKLRSPLELRRRLASKSHLTEDFLHRRWDEHPRRPDFAAPAGRVLLHAHCHQKALWGAESSAALVRRAVADRLRVLDTGCCGMAGSFGYAAHRFDLSNSIGELTLFPAARAMQSGDVLLAPGTSCRHQLHDGVQVNAMHPVTFLASLLR